MYFTNKIITKEKRVYSYESLFTLFYSIYVKAQKINNIIMFEYKSHFININIIYTSNYIFEHVLY